jgi:putative hydrolase of the HAD superfamily
VANLSFDAVLCDIDGVLRLWDAASTAELEKRYVVPPGKLTATACAPYRIGPALTGRITDEEWRAWVARAMLPFCGSVDRAAALVSEWSAQQGLIDDEVLDLLTQARRSVPVALVGNGTTRLERDLRSLGIDRAVDAVVSSARVGAATPDPEIYLAAASVLRVEPGRCLYVDDAQDNVTAAEAVGMHGVRYDGPDCLRTALASLELVLS